MKDRRQRLKRKKRSSGLARTEARDGWLFVTPFLLGVTFLWVGPMLYSLYLVAHRWTMLESPRFVGFGNITDLLSDKLVGTSLGNTAYYTFLSVPLGAALALMLAVALNQKLRGEAVFRTIFYLPSITPAVASAVVWRQLFNFEYGPVNNILQAVGLPPVHWLFDPRAAKPAFIVMSLWGIGGAMVTFLAGLQSVPQELVEAASMDGANSWQRFRVVTIPMISPVIFFNLVMGVIGSLQVFASSYILTDGGPQNATLFMVLYIFRNGFEWHKMGYATTLAWVLFWIIMLFTFIQFRAGRRWVYYETEAG